MPNSTTSGLKTRIIKKLLVLLGVAAFAILSFLAGLVLFLPTIVSSTTFKGFFENQVSSVIHRRLQIETLEWDTTGEITIKNLSIKDDPAFSTKPLLLVKRARCQVFWGEILKGRLHIDVLLDGIQSALIRNRQGQTNLAVWLAGLKPAKAAAEQPQPKDSRSSSFTVPCDIQSRVHISNICVQVEDRVQAKQLALKNATVRFDVPSLYGEPMTLKASTNIAIEGHNLPAAHLNILIKNLFDTHGSLNLTDLYLDMQGTCPGVDFVLNSNQHRSKINSRLKLDLLKITKLLEPVIPPRILPDTIMGNLTFRLDGSGNPQESLAFITTLEGQNLVFAGGVFGDKALGPLNFNMVNSGVLDDLGSRLAIENGSLVLLKDSRLAWNGELKDLRGVAPEVNLRFDLVRLDIAELVEKFKAFLPKGVTIESQKQKHSPTLEIKHAGFSGPLLSGPHAISIKDLVLELPLVRVYLQKPQDVALSAHNIRLDVKQLRSTLTQFIPDRVSLSAALSADSVDVKGIKEIHVKKVSMPAITVVADEIRRSQNTLMGLSVRLKVRETLTARNVSLPPLININNFQQTLSTELEFSANPLVRVAATDFTFDIPDLIIADSDYGPFNTNAGLDGHIDDVSLLNTDPLNIDIQGVRSDLRIDNILGAHFETDVQDLAKKFVRTRGNVSIDMASLSEKWMAKLADKFKLTGAAKFNWDIEGRLPHKTARAKPGSAFIDGKANLDFIDRMNIDWTIKDMGVDWAASEDRHLKIASVSTESPVRYRFEKQTGKGQSAGKLLLRGIQLPSREALDKDLSADIFLSAEHDDLKSIIFSQVGVLKPANIKQTLNISLNGLDRLFKRGLSLPLPAWFEYVGGTVRGTLNVSEQTDLTKFIDDLEFEGQLETGAELLLVPGKNIKLQGWALGPEIDVKLGELLNVTNLKTNVNLKKNYRIIGAAEGEEDENRLMPLSVSVLKAEPGPAIGSVYEFDTQDAMVSKLIGTLRNRFSQEHALALDAAHLGVGPLPLAVERVLMDFDLNEGLPNSDYFQVEMLGGTIIGSLAVIEKNETFFLNTQLAFTGLHTDRIFPAADPLGNDASELSGRLTALIPLSVRLESLLREFSMDLKLSRIGPRSLERLLYALDPAESNEAIVSQRQLLRKGFPRRIDVRIKDGNLSLDGEIEVQGVSVEIPSLRRLNIANISGIDKYADHLVGLGPAIEILKLCAANTIRIGENGWSMNFERRK